MVEGRNEVQKINYRKLAFKQYPPICAHCGFGIPEILEVAHLDGDRTNNEIGNLAILCPNYHKMHDIDIISTEIIIKMRDAEKRVDWGKRLKDAAQKAAVTRKRRAAGRKAAKTAANRKAIKTVGKNTDI
jgi:hypothetical protein